jgi:hypothetical protein
MTSTIDRLRELRRGGVWQEPTWGMPLPLDVGQLRPLGRHKGRDWYAWKDCELEQRGALLDVSSPAVADGPSLRVWKGDDQYLQPLAVHPPGTYAARSAAVPSAPKQQATPRVVDALAAWSLLRRTPRDRSEPVQVRGAPEIIARLASRGTELHLATDGASLVVKTRNPSTDLRALIRDVAPLLLPYLKNGQPPGCVVTAHDGEPPPAITVAVGGAVWCMRRGQ